MLAYTTPALARDNLLVIVADDVGIDGIGVYSSDDLYGHPGEGGSPGPTPNIDTLASEGILFRNAYANPVCSPTRAAMLTGRHGFRTGIGSPEGAVLALDETTVAELLSATHRAAAFGKWHLGPARDAEHPIESGFEYYAGSLGGGVDDYRSWSKVTSSSTTNAVTQREFTTYATIDAADEAIAKISEFGDEQWFVWLAFNAAHTPFHVPPDDLITMTVDDASDDETKFRAAVEAMDHEIGRVLASIPAEVLSDTTVVFIGDNGSPRASVEPPFDGTRAKGSVYEGGINVPLIVRSPKVDPSHEGTESLALVGAVDVFATLLDLAGATSIAEDSVSWVPYLEDPERATLTRREWVYAERFEPNGQGPYDDHRRAIRDGEYKVIWRDGVYEGMFRVVSDPFELTNLLPLENLTVAERGAYDRLVATMEAIADFGPSVSTTTLTTTTTMVTTTTFTPTTTTTSSTTTTITSTSTTTLAMTPMCGDPDGDGLAASDALFALQAAVRIKTCDLCLCDADDSGSVTASDALRILNRAVEIDVAMLCPAC